MFYTIYKITNNLDGKYYIGKHQTKDLNDGYFGSGKVLKRAIQKHGIENFTKEILHVFDTEEEMNTKEKELVILEESSYNLCPGGQGGWGYVNTNGLGISDNQKQAARIIRKTVCQTKYKEWLSSLSEEDKKTWKQNISKSKLGDKNPLGFKGKSHTEKTKQKMSQSNKGKVPWNKGKAWKDWHPNAR